MTKILSLILSLVMISSSLVMPTFAAETDDVNSKDIDLTKNTSSLYPDVKITEDYYPELELLSKLDIIKGDDKGNFNPDSTITRAEATAIVTRMIGYNFANGSSETNFKDVPASHWASGAIASGTSMGLVVGYGDGNFGPEDPVKYEEIITMIIRALGYEPMVKSVGGEWPYNYTSTASRIGLNSTVTGYKVGDDAPRKLVASLISNALEKPIMKQVSYGSNIEYAEMNGSYNRELETILGTVFDTYKIRGLVSVTDKSSVNGASYTQTNYAKIEIYDAYDYEVLEEYVKDEELLTIHDGGKLRSYVGNPIIAYITESDRYSSDYDLLSFSIDEKKHDSVVIDDVKDIDLSDSDRATRNFGSSNDDKPVLVVWNNDGNKRKNYYIDKEATILLNDNFYANVKDSIVTKDIFDIDYGTITLTDSNNDNSYDIIKIDVYVTMVVDEINEKYQKITDLNNYQPALRFDDYYIDDDELSVKFVFNGKEIKFSDLKQYDVLSIKANVMNGNKIDVKEADNYYIVVTRDTIEGKVNSTGTDSDGVPYYGIGNKEYNLVPGLGEDISLSDEGTFYLDQFGRIAYFEVGSSSSHNYAYIYRVGTSSSSFDDYVEMKLVFSDGTNSILKTPIKGFTIYDNGGESHKVHVGSTTNSAESFFGEGWDEKIEGQMVSYDKNTSGEINKIYLPRSKDDSSKTFSLDKQLTEAKYKENSETLGNVLVGKSTKIFFIPDKVNDISDITVGTISSLEDDEYYDADFYDLDNDLVARLIVVKSDTNVVQLKKDVYVVADVFKAMNKNEDVTQKLVMYYQGTKQTLWVDPDEEEFDVTEGDIVAIRLNANGEISDLVKMFDVTKPSLYELEDFRIPGSNVDEVQTAVGYVTNKKKNTFSISVNPNGEGELLYGSNANVYRVEGSKRNVEAVEWEDLETYDNNEDTFVFIRTYEEDVSDIVIYENINKNMKPSSERYTYEASIAKKEFKYSTTVNDVLSEISIKERINGIENGTFVADASKIVISGFSANVIGDQTLTISYNGKAAGTLTIKILEPVITYSASNKEVAYPANVSLETIKNDVTIEKSIDGVKDTSFTKDNALLELVDLNLNSYEIQNIVVKYDSKAIASLTFKINAPVVTYNTEISKTEFSYFTTANEIKNEIIVKKYVDGTLDETFTYDPALVSLNNFIEKKTGVQTINVLYNGEEIDFFDITIKEPVRTYTASISTTVFLTTDNVDTIKNAITIEERLDGVLNTEFVKDNSKLVIDGVDFTTASQYAMLAKYDNQNILVKIITINAPAEPV